MNWKNLSIAKKIGCGIGFVVLLLGVVSTFSYTGIGNIVINTREVIEGNKLDGLIAQKEVDHLK